MGVQVLVWTAVLGYILPSFFNDMLISAPKAHVANVQINLTHTRWKQANKAEVIPSVNSVEDKSTVKPYTAVVYVNKKPIKWKLILAPWCHLYLKNTFPGLSFSSPPLNSAHILLQSLYQW